MIVCKRCGNQNPDGEPFCKACGAYLEWTGEKVAEPAPPPRPPPPPPVEPPRPGIVQRVKDVVAREEAGHPASPGVTGPGVTPPPPAVSGPGPAGATGGPPTQSAPAATPPVQPVVPEHPATQPPAGANAAALVSPLPPSTSSVAPAQQPEAAAGQPVARQPVAVAPTTTRPRPPPKVDPSTGQAFNPGDLICGQCGAGNDPERHFCRRCGSSLAQAMTVRLRWYQRLFGTRQPKVVAAGERPASIRGEGGFRPPAIAVVGAVVLLLAGVYILVPPVHGQVDATVQSGVQTVRLNFASSTVSVVPFSASASSELQGHTAAMAIDGFSNTYWEADQNRDPQPTLTLTFSSPTDIDSAIFTNGLEDNYSTLARPKTLHITYSDGTSQDVTILDQHKQPAIQLHAHAVRSMSIKVTSVYPSQQSKIMALAEVELFKRQ